MAQFTFPLYLVVPRRLLVQSSYLLLELGGALPDFGCNRLIQGRVQIRAGEQAQDVNHELVGLLRRARPEVLDEILAQLAGVIA